MAEELSPMVLVTYPGSNTNAEVPRDSLGVWIDAGWAEITLEAAVAQELAQAEVFVTMTFPEDGSEASVRSDLVADFAAAGWADPNAAPTPAPAKSDPKTPAAVVADAGSTTTSTEG